MSSHCHCLPLCDICANGACDCNCTPEYIAKVRADRLRAQTATQSHQVDVRRRFQSVQHSLRDKGLLDAHFCIDAYRPTNHDTLMEKVTLLLEALDNRRLMPQHPVKGKKPSLRERITGAENG